MIEEVHKWQKLEYLFRQIDFFLEKNTRRYLTSQGLTYPRFVLLAEVCVNPGLSLTELYEKMGVTLSTLSSVADQLVSDGLLTRERCSVDRRLIELNPTQEGRFILEDVLKYRYSLIRNVLELMSNEKVSSFITIVEEFVSHI